MKKIILIIIVLICFFSSESQVINDSVFIEGHYRFFHFKKPQANNSHSSLVFVLHGSYGTGLEIMKTAAKLEDESQTENLLLVYPDGYKNFWNECRKEATSAANLENINEEAFFNKTIDYFIKNYHINPKHVFAIGTSGGGHMAYKLALTMPGKFKAITAIIANLPDTGNMDCIESRVPISVMIINGTNDPVNPYDGGEVKVPGVKLGKVRSTNQTFQYWARLDGYSGEPTKEKLPDLDSTNGLNIECYSYDDKRKPDVVLLKVIGGKHNYPNDIDVYLEAWKFFKRQIEKE